MLTQKKRDSKAGREDRLHAWRGCMPHRCVSAVPQRRKNRPQRKMRAPGRIAGMNRRASQKCSGQIRIL